MPSLAQQLKQLEAEDAPSRVDDPESAYTSIDALEVGTREGDEGREHYLDVGPSRLRKGLGNGSDQTLLSEKYGGKRVGRMKIFDDDDEEDEEEEHEQDDGISDDQEDEDEEGEDDEDDDEDEDEDEEEEDEDEEGEEDRTEGEEEEASHATRPAATRTLDPLAALRESRAKDIEKGKAVRAQKQLFESLLTMRITLQKAVTSTMKLPTPLPEDPEGETEAKRAEVLLSLAKLNERLTGIRRDAALPGVEFPETVGKRKRDEGDELEEGYWVNAGKESLEMTDATEPQFVSVLNKWSNKIQAATLQMGSKQAGGSKFLQSTKDGSSGIMDAIEAGLATKRDSDKTLFEHEEASYRTLLREVIESRTGSAAGPDLSHLRREKKKKREAERGASKGRKLRYTVHEKAQNFVVPIPLRHGWHEEQVDELFSSLLGGAGLKGAGAEASAGALLSGSAGQGLQGLRVL